MDGMKQPPKRLKGDARKKWVEVVEDIQPSDSIAREMLCQYCESWALYIAASCQLDKEGLTVAAKTTGAIYPHPSIGTRNKAADQMRRIYTLLKGKTKKQTESFEDLDG